MKLIIGIDPDSKAHGVAVYDDKELIDLRNMTLMQIIDYTTWCGDITIHIEDVNAMSAVFAQRTKARGNASVHMKMANSVGKCQQSQIELERFFEHKGIKVVKHKISKMWKKDRKQFEIVTGWTKQSNEDTRSAAYFGYLGCR
tara:strand:- start:129 stop:557 length:429 start_codon:yes stop_codon:yes gene_type:complete